MTMSRQRVIAERPDRLRRCDTCKRRRKKCSGTQPCSSCVEREVQCLFSNGFENESVNQHEAQPDSPVRSGLKHTIPLPEYTPFKPRSPARYAITDPLIPRAKRQLLDPESEQPRKRQNTDAQIPMISNRFHKASIDRGALSIGLLHQSDQELLASVEDSSIHLSNTSKERSAGQEEIIPQPSSRTISDLAGKLLYVGDSATLSYLQLISMVVESIDGPSPFTTDPQRYLIVESELSLPAGARHTHLLPDKLQALLLVESFFVNTSGLVQIFNLKSFMDNVDTCYSDPLNVAPSWLCLLHLVFAIGLVLVSPLSNTRGEVVIEKLGSETSYRAEVFFSNAKSLHPSALFEDPDFWSVQALCLMAIYTMSVSKRNASYAYLSMAIRSAFALGLHREETLVVFDVQEQAVRRSVFRTLFVLDRFLSASLGRPTAISEVECSSNVLGIDEGELDDAATRSTTGETRVKLDYAGLEASVRSCHVIGTILKKIYSKRRVSTKIAQQIACECKAWHKKLDPSLHWSQAEPASQASPGHGIAILHINLLYCHSIILLTRPFFIFLLNKLHQEQFAGVKEESISTGSPSMENFSEACMVASIQSIVMVQKAWEGGYLVPRNPFVTYFISAAALIVITNEFSGLYDAPMAQVSIDSSIEIMKWCSNYDPLAARLVSIFISFRDVSSRRKGLRRSTPKRQLAMDTAAPLTNIFNDWASKESPDQNMRISARVNMENDTTSRFEPEQFDPTLFGVEGNSPAAIHRSHSPVIVRHKNLDGSETRLRVEIESALDVDVEVEIVDFEVLWKLP